jgi:hypothetical protein
MPIPNSQKRGQFFIRTHNEPHPVTAMRVNNFVPSFLIVSGLSNGSFSYIWPP